MLGAPNELLFCVYFVVYCTVGILLGKSIHFYVLLARRNTFVERLFKNFFVKWSLSPQSGKYFLEPWKFSEIRDVHDEMHLIHSCYGAGWENISAIFLGVKNTF